MTDQIIHSAMAGVLGADAAADMVRRMKEKNPKVDGIVAARYGALVGRRDASLEYSDLMACAGRNDEALESYKDWLLYEKTTAQIEGRFNIRFQ